MSFLRRAGCQRVRYLGDAAFQRPPPETEGLADRFYEAVYLRENPAGPHQELWYHASGCLSGCA